MKHDNDDGANPGEFDHDPLDEPAMPARDRKGRFARGSSGNPAGRKFDYRVPRDPALPASRRRLIHKVADEEVEVKVNGKAVRMALFEANVRSLGIAGTRSRVAAQRFIDLVLQTSDRHAISSAQARAVMEGYIATQEELERLRAKYEPPQHGVMDVPVDDLNNWPPEGLIVDGKVNMEMYDELREKRRLRDAAKGEGGEES